MHTVRSLAASLATLGAVAAITLSTTARATYSVLLTNTTTGEIGGAVTSCVGDFDLERVFGAQVNNANRAPEAPTETTAGPAERIAFFTQGLYSQENHDQVSAWIASGITPNAIIDAITAPSFDPRAAERQYHFLSTSGAGLTWTGAETLPHSAGLTHSVGSWTYTLAGNILTSERVLLNMDAALRAARGSIEERLLVALEAGGTLTEGDARCSPNPGDSAFLIVFDAHGATRIRQSVVDTRSRDPLELLRLAVLPAPVDTSMSAPTSTPDVSSTDTDSSQSAASAREMNSCGVAHTPPRFPWTAWFGLIWFGRRYLAKRRPLA